MLAATDIPTIDALELGIAASLVFVAGFVSILFRLRLEKQLAIAGIRTIVQLFLMAGVLHWVFEHATLPIVLLAAGAMTVAATHAATRRTQTTYRGIAWRTFLTLILTGLVTTFTVTTLIVKPETHWYQPQFFIPLLGMVLGNALTGVSLCMDSLLSAFKEKRDQVEMELSLGASRWEASRPLLADAVRRGMIPIVNAMTVVGIVSIPGMMTGQIIQGADPIQAAKYQIVVMFMIAAAASLGCMAIALLTYRHMFDANHRLRAELLVERK